jgi:hypothetical protein
MAQCRRSLLHGLVALPAGSLLAMGRSARPDLVVGDGAGLQRALRTAVPGTVISLAPGEFGGVAQFDLFTPDVTLRAAEPLRAVLRAPLIVSGARATLSDLAFWGEGEDGYFLSAVAACRDSLSITAPDVEVRGCDFGYFGGRAILVRPGGLRVYIHDCSFHDNRAGGDKNVHEAISLGYDNPNSDIAMGARVIGNKLWNLNVEDEAICVKTSGNLIQGNQISSSKGAYSNRYGERNKYINNVSINSRGFLVEDRVNSYIGNRVDGAGSYLVLGGEVNADERRNGFHIQATSTYFENNTGLLVIGANYSGTHLPALDTSVKSHAGSIQLRNQRGTRLPS